jgi:predicted O-methyltransferase YrrM
MGAGVKSVVRRVPGARALYAALQRWRFRRTGGGRYGQRYYHATLSHALQGRARQSDISDHLGTLFFFATNARPQLIVELGTRGGESTCALLAAAEESSAAVLSIDMDECGGLDLPYRERWTFVRGDDVEFGRDRFPEWCGQNGRDPVIDVLFIDTSHEYEHSKAEIEAWFPHLAPGAVVIFHDTNMGRGAYARMDGSTGFGWNNDRGVIRAIEEYLGRRYDENSFFCDQADEFLVLHHPHNNGLTVLQRTR